MLLERPETVRNELQKRITSLTLTASTTKYGDVYTVSGDIDLFFLPEGVLQADQVDLIGLQYETSLRMQVATKPRPMA